MKYLKKIKDIYNNTKYYFSNLKKWNSIIWSDRDWDHYYLLDVMQFKLDNMSKYIGEKDRHDGSQKAARNLKLCSDLIEKIKSSFYEVEYQDYYKQNIDFSKGRVKFVVTSNNLSEYLEKNKLIIKKLIKSGYNPDLYDKKDLLTAMKIGSYKHEHAKRLLFKIMFENVEQWWD